MTMSLESAWFGSSVWSDISMSSSCSFWRLEPEAKGGRACCSVLVLAIRRWPFPAGSLTFDGLRIQGRLLGDCDFGGVGSP